MVIPGGIGHWVPLVVASVATLPAAYLAYRLLVRRAVRRGVPVDRARRCSFAEVGIVAGTLPWLWMAFTPMPAPRELRLVPVVDLVEVLAGDGLTALFQVLGNLLVFAAFGLLAPLRWPIGPVAVTLLAGAGSIVVELVQYALALGRVTSVDDVLLNTAGAGLAALLSRPLLRRPHP